MAVLTDTNIFLRLLQPRHPHCRIAEKALDFLRAREEILNITSQNLDEFWAAATRPFDENGLGLTVGQTAREVDQHRVLGKNSHDARVVAAMHMHGIEKILAFNVRDFVRYRDITVLDPAKVG